MTMKSEPRARSLSLFSMEFLCAVIVSACAPMAIAQSIVTVAGGGTSSLEGLPATAVILSGVSALATDARGNVYVSDTGANSVYRISKAEGTISVFAGNGGGTFSGDGGQATQASLKNPRGLVFDEAGNLYIADSGNGRVRKVDAITGRITTFAGDPDRSDIGDNGPATSAQLFTPAGLAWNQGSLYITETTYDHNGVRKVDPQGTITTVAGKHLEVSGFSGDGGLATEAVFSEPGAIAVDGSGNLYIADSANSRVRRVDAASRIVTTVIGGGSPADDVGDGGLGTDAKLARPTALVFDAAGKLLIADAYNQRGLIRKYDPVSKIITTIAGNGDYGGGDDGPAKEAGIYAPFALAIDANQNIFVHDGSNGSVRRIDAATQIITRFAGGGNFIGDGRVAPAAVLSLPLGIAVDARGDLLITDPGHSLLRKVSAESGIITTIAGRLNDCCGGGEVRSPPSPRSDSLSTLRLPRTERSTLPVGR